MFFVGFELFMKSRTTRKGFNDKHTRLCKKGEMGKWGVVETVFRERPFLANDFFQMGGRKPFPRT